MRRPLGGSCTGSDGHLHRLYDSTAPSRSRNIYRHGCGPHGGRLSLDFLPRLEPLVLGLWRRQRRQQPNGNNGNCVARGLHRDRCPGPETVLEPDRCRSSHRSPNLDGNNPLSATTLASFSDTFTLGTQSYVDFYVLDQLVSDNGGGIALNVTQVDHAPEPASFLLVVTALAAGGLRLRRRAR